MKSKYKIKNGVIRRLKNDASIRQGYCCKYCFEPFKVSPATADHRVPRSMGGMTLEDNIDAVCRACNCLKDRMTAGEFTKAIKSPSGSVGMLLAYSRRRIWLAAHRACRNIKRGAGLNDNGPLSRKEEAA